MSAALSATAERDVIAAWATRGRPLDVLGAGTSVWEQGTGQPVVCLHGVPASSFLYRKVLGELAGRGCRGIAFDFPGLGLADRPKNFDYSWAGLSAWTVAATEALGLGRFHLVVHDIGGPIGFDVVARIAAGAHRVADGAQHHRACRSVQASLVDGAVRAPRDR